MVGREKKKHHYVPELGDVDGVGGDVDLPGHAVVALLRRRQRLHHDPGLQKLGHVGEDRDDGHGDGVDGHAGRHRVGVGQVAVHQREADRDVPGGGGGKHEQHAQFRDKLPTVEPG